MFDKSEENIERTQRIREMKNRKKNIRLNPSYSYACRTKEKEERKNYLKQRSVFLYQNEKKKLTRTTR